MKGTLFKPDMIKAVMEGRKTQTRRLAGLKKINQKPDAWELWAENIPDNKGRIWFNTKAEIASVIVAIKPRFQVGEVVYIKEAYRVLDIDLRTLDSPMEIVKVEYKLDCAGVWLPKPKEKPIVIPDKWRSPLFMPAWAARTHIKILSVKPERLQEITWQDCVREGIHAPDHEFELLIGNFQTLWDSINPKYLWASNPWIWRYEFGVASQL